MRGSIRESKAATEKFARQLSAGIARKVKRLDKSERENLHTKLLEIASRTQNRNSKSSLTSLL